MNAPPDRLDLSLNEVETLAQKAARGAGLPWGVAEDAGRAAAWMARRVGPWADQLLALLQTPPPADQSPLLLAGWLADHAGERLIARVAWPVWALPGLLITTPRPVSIFLDDVEVRCEPAATPTATVQAEALATLRYAAVRAGDGAAPLPPLTHALPEKFRRSEVPPAAWDGLQTLAYRTYVPASARSRLTGAGGGRLDDE